MNSSESYEAKIYSNEPNVEESDAMKVFGKPSNFILSRWSGGVSIALATMLTSLLLSVGRIFQGYIRPKLSTSKVNLN